MSKLEILSWIVWGTFVIYASLLFDVHFFSRRGFGLYLIAIGYGITERLRGQEA